MPRQSQNKAVAEMEERLRQILRDHWGYSDFRGIQREIIESVCQGRDTLGLMPTGGGKSVTFQVPTLAMEGMCLVVTPLIALMKDQVANLRRRGIRAAAIHSGMSRDEVIATLENCVFGAVKLLYVSPERLASDLFIAKIKHTKVCLIAVDEAHCISQWGYDFRPSYLQIVAVRAILPGIPVLALTATATPEVADDIQERLGFKEKNVFRMSFERENLAYVVRHAPDKVGEMAHILGNVVGSAIVYVRSRQRAKELAEWLVGQGEQATYFHAGLDNHTRDERQRDWTQGKVRTMVATNAFGMGIDKPDVRLVIHVDMPDSLEAYFQEAGRAGRDGKKAYAVLLYNTSDNRKMAKRLEEEFPPKDYVRQVYEHVAYFFQVAEGSGCGIPFDFDIIHFCSTFKHSSARVDSALRILQRAGYIEYTPEEEHSTRVMFTLSRDELYRLRNNSPLEDSVIETLLRNYGGIFCDFRPIDETLVAEEVGRTRQEVHQVLKELGHKRIIKFIPRKLTPIVRYVRGREDPRRLVFKREVYDALREQAARRMAAMMRYATDDSVCRSRQLLRYFGESRLHDCCQCDVCLRRRGELPSEEQVEAAERQIDAVLGDGARHHLTELLAIKMPTEAVDEALRRMLHEELVAQDDGFVYKES